MHDDAEDYTTAAGGGSMYAKEQLNEGNDDLETLSINDTIEH